MVILRRTNDDCFCCGTQIPNDVTKKSTGDYHVFYCNGCGTRLLEGIVSTDGEPADAPHAIPVDDRSILLDPESNWKRVEVWWTNMEHVSIIHGHVVSGHEELHDFVKQLHHIYHDD